MRNPKSLIASVVLLLLCTGGAAVADEPTDFALEFVMPERLPPGRAVVVRCLEGCDWSERTIQCPVDQPDCRALIAGRRLDTLESIEARRPKAQPIRDSQCLGLQVITDPPGEMQQHCKETSEKDVSNTECYSEEIPAADSRAYVNDVGPKSPAALAGLSPGDVIVNLNGAPMAGRMDVFYAVRKMKAGQSFDALLERDGAPMTVQGRVGIAMSDGACVVADARRLETAVKYEPTLDYGSFKLEFDLPGVNVEFNCLEGCSEGRGGNMCGYSFNGPAEKCTIQIYQAPNGEWTVGTREVVDSQLRQSKQEQKAQ